MSDFIFRIQPNIVLGSYTTSRLGQYIREFGTKFMLIIDPILKQVGNADKIIQPLEERKIDFFTFDEITDSCDTQVIRNVLNLAREAHVHGIIAVGGGKTLNLAKAVCALYNETREIYDFIDGTDGIVPSAEALPLIAVPTTIRDSFIFTDKIPMTDARSSKIRVLKSQGCLTRLTLFDPNSTSTLTENQSRSMAIESLCLATEAFLSQKSTFFSDMIAEKAVELIGYAFDGSNTLTITSPQEVLLSQAGCMASLASASSSIGATTLISLCVNARYNVSRALVSSILFPHIIEDASKFRADRLAHLSKLIRACPQDASNEDAAKAFAEYVRQHSASSNLPSRLKDVNLTMEQLALSAEDAGDLDLINCLQRSMTSDDLFELIKLAY